MFFLSFIKLFLMCNFANKNIMVEFNFDDIRPHRDEDAKAAVERILASGKIEKLLSAFMSKQEIDFIINQLSSVETIDDFQIGIVKQVFEKINSKVVDEIEVVNLDKLNNKKGYLFISNHRDIVLDPSNLALILTLNGFQTQEVAIGSNLLIESWIDDLVRLNKSFIVRRDVQGRELLLASKKMSAYIRSVIFRNSNVWIAQREGRAKDGNDKTQTSLLKMLNLGCKSKDLNQSFSLLNILPFAISYEYDACDVLKAKELYIKSLGENYIKTPQDDLKSMKYGLIGLKGRITYSFGNVITAEELPITEDLNEICEKLAELIDNQIYSNFKLYPSHYISYDLYNKTNKFSNNYSQEDSKKFIELIDYKINLLTPEYVGNEDFKLQVFRQYSNIVENHLSVNQ